MNKIKTLIIEDQIPTQDLIEGILEHNCPNISICGKAANIISAKTIIKEHEPELIISDIMLGQDTSFELFEALAEDGFSCKIIFVTAHESFAIPAINFEAFGFILKPIDPDQLIGLVHKLEAKLNMTAEEYSSSVHKVVFKTQEGWHIVKLTDIIRCESDKGYSTIYTKSQGNITLAKKIIDIQKIIFGPQFLRIHQSHLVNISEIQLLKKGRNTMLRLSDKSLLPVSASKKQIVFERLSSFPSI